jgi:hydroxyacid-oxoacid transhydrogenase
MTMMFETAFTMDTTSIKYGPGVTCEIGFDMKQLGSKRVMVVTDANLAHTKPVAVVLDALNSEGIDAILYDRVRIEPTDISFKDAIAFAVHGRFDGYVAVGGGSTIDTAKAADLYTTYPADFPTYVNPPIGKGKTVPGRLMPMIAIPTTAGTGSETTGAAIFDYLEMHAKTGIAHRALRPVMGILDPINTRSMPKMVSACSGMDVLCHALESLTALPCTKRAAPENPGIRPTYQGSNPISDMWAARAIQMVSENLVRAVDDTSDDNARSEMLLASAYAGIGFGNAGVHLAHGMSYAVSGLVRDFVAEGYPKDLPLIPHGMAVTLNAPAVFRFTASANPERHLYAAKLMGVDVRNADKDTAGELLASAVINLMRQIGLPNGLGAVGYGPDDVPRLVAGTIPQRRVTDLSPRVFSEDDLKQLFLNAMSYW